MEWTDDDLHALFNYMLDPEHSERRISSQREVWPHVCSCCQLVVELSGWV